MTTMQGVDSGVTGSVVGASKRFECQVIGLPRPSVRWYKDGVNVSTHSRYKFEYTPDGFVVLILENVNLTDQGVYQCRAENSEGSAETTAKLLVKGIEEDSVHDVSLVHTMSFRPVSNNETSSHQSQKRPLIFAKPINEDIVMEEMSTSAVTMSTSECYVPDISLNDSFLSNGSLNLSAEHDADISQNDELFNAVSELVDHTSKKSDQSHRNAIDSGITSRGSSFSSEPEVGKSPDFMTEMKAYLHGKDNETFHQNKEKIALSKDNENLSVTKTQHCQTINPVNEASTAFKLDFRSTKKPDEFQIFDPFETSIMAGKYLFDDGIEPDISQHTLKFVEFVTQNREYNHIQDVYPCHYESDQDEFALTQADDNSSNNTKTCAVIDGDVSLSERDASNPKYQEGNEDTLGECNVAKISQETTHIDRSQNKKSSSERKEHELNLHDENSGIDRDQFSSGLTSNANSDVLYTTEQNDELYEKRNGSNDNAENFTKHKQFAIDLDIDRKEEVLHTTVQQLRRLSTQDNITQGICEEIGHFMSKSNETTTLDLKTCHIQTTKPIPDEHHMSIVDLNIDRKEEVLQITSVQFRRPSAQDDIVKELIEGLPNLQLSISETGSKGLGSNDLRNPFTYNDDIVINALDNDNTEEAGMTKGSHTRRLSAHDNKVIELDEGYYNLSRTCHNVDGYGVEAIDGNIPGAISFNRKKENHDANTENILLKHKKNTHADGENDQNNKDEKNEFKSPSETNNINYMQRQGGNRGKLDHGVNDEKEARRIAGMYLFGNDLEMLGNEKRDRTQEFHYMFKDECSEGLQQDNCSINNNQEQQDESTSLTAPASKGDSDDEIVINIAKEELLALPNENSTCETIGVNEAYYANSTLTPSIPDSTTVTEKITFRSDVCDANNTEEKYEEIKLLQIEKAKCKEAQKLSNITNTKQSPKLVSTDPVNFNENVESISQIELMNHNQITEDITIPTLKYGNITTVKNKEPSQTECVSETENTCLATKMDHSNKSVCKNATDDKHSNNKDVLAVTDLTDNEAQLVLVQSFESHVVTIDDVFSFINITKTIVPVQEATVYVSETIEDKISYQRIKVQLEGLTDGDIIEIKSNDTIVNKCTADKLETEEFANATSTIDRKLLDKIEEKGPYIKTQVDHELPDETEIQGPNINSNDCDIVDGQNRPNETMSSKSVTTESTEFTSYVGNRIVLKWKIHGIRPGDVRVYKDGVILVPNNERLLLELGQDICTLTITRATLDDQALYTVRVNNTVTDLAKICVYVTDEGLSRERWTEPVFVLEPTVNVTNDQKLSVKCAVEGFPAPIVTWYCHGKQLEHDALWEVYFQDGYHHLGMGDPSSLNFEEIVCRVENEEGFLQRVIHLKKEGEEVFIEPVLPPVSATHPGLYNTPPTLELEISETNSDNLCQLQLQTPYTDRTNLMSLDTGDCIEIMASHTDDVILARHTELHDKICYVPIDILTYVIEANDVRKQECTENVPNCSAQLINKSSEKQELSSINTESSHHAIIMPERRKMKSPSPKMTSTPKMKRKGRDGDSPTELQTRLGIKENLASKKEISQSDAIDLSEYNDGTTRPLFKKRLRNVSANSGELAQLECVVSGTPLPKVLWLKNNRPLKAADGCKVIVDEGQNVLVFPSARDEDVGIYTARAMNVNGSLMASAEFTLNDGKGLSAQTMSESPMDLDFSTPTYFFQMSSCEVAEGRVARFDCRVVAYPRPEIVWMRDGKVVESMERFKLLNFNNEIYSLLIQDVHMSDTGRYTCWARNKFGEAMTEAYLNVIALTEQDNEGDLAPKFLTKFYDQQTAEGIQTDFRCLVAGRPEPSVTWLLGDEELRDSQATRLRRKEGVVSLEIKSPKLDQSGLYTCQLSNPLGDALCSAKLTVVEDKLHGKMLPKFLKKFDHVNTRESEEVKFTCIVVGEPKPDIIWMFDHKPISDTNRRYTMKKEGDAYTLTIKSARFEDGGTITCKAVNTEGEVYCSANLHIRESKFTRDTPEQTSMKTGEEGKPDSKFGYVPTFTKRLHDMEVKEGAKAMLECQIMGIPEPEVSWMRDGRVITPGGRYHMTREGGNCCLVIDNVSAADTGVYTCIISNNQGKSSTTAHLKLEGEKKERYTPDRFLDDRTVKKERYTPDKYLEDSYTTPAKRPYVELDRIEAKPRKSKGRARSSSFDHTYLARPGKGFESPHRSKYESPVRSTYESPVRSAYESPVRSTFDDTSSTRPRKSYGSPDTSLTRSKKSYDIKDLSLPQTYKPYESPDTSVKRRNKSYSSLSDETTRVRRHSVSFDDSYSSRPKSTYEDLYKSRPTGGYDSPMYDDVPRSRPRSYGSPARSTYDDTRLKRTYESPIRSLYDYDDTSLNRSRRNYGSPDMSLTRPRKNYESPDLSLMSYKPYESPLLPYGREDVSTKVPKIPFERPTMFNKRDDSVRLSWMPAPTHELPSDARRVSYVVESRELPSKGWTKIASSVPGTSYIVKHLRPDKEYEFRVRAQNQYGASEPTWAAPLEKRVDETRRFADLPEMRAPPRLPTHRPFITDLGEETVRLAWQPAETYQSKRSPPVSYRLEAKELPGKDWMPLSSRLRDTSHYLPELAHDRDYMIRVRAENDYGISEPTESLWLPRARAFPGVPVTRPEIDQMDDHRARLSWDRVDIPAFGLDDTPLTYMIEVEEPPQDWRTVARDLDDTEYFMDGLKAGTDYRFRVRARTPAGVVSEPSPAVSMYTTLARSRAPVDRLEVLEYEPDTSSVRLAWQRVDIPPYNMEDEPLMYMLEYNEPPMPDWRPLVTGIPTTRYRVMHLDPERDYNFRVRAVTPYGLSPPSTTLPVSLRQTPATTGLPEAVIISDVQPDSVQLTWRRPMYDLSTPITYQIEMLEPPSNVWQPIAFKHPETSYKVTGLRPTKDYQFRVIPQTDTRHLTATPAASLTSSAVRPRLPLSEPTLKELSPDSVQLSWRPAEFPVYQRTRSPIYYGVEMQELPSSNWVPVARRVADTSYVVTGLRPNHDYKFRVLAETDLYKSEPSLSTNLHRMPAPRFSRNEPIVRDINKNIVMLSWEPAAVPSGYTDADVTYRVEMQTPPGISTWQTLYDAHPTPSVRLADLRSDLDYLVRVRAQSGNIVTEPTMPVYIPRRAVPPRIPVEEPYVVEIQPDSIKLQWRSADLPSHIMDYAPVTYRLEARELPGADWVTVAQGIPHTDFRVTGLNPQRDYAFRVRAVNDYGMSDPTRHTSVPKRSVAPVLPTDEPLMYDVTSGSVRLSWRPATLPSNVASPSPMTYTIYMQELPHQTWRALVRRIPHTSYHVTGLRSDREYNFRVQAENEYGSSKPTQGVYLPRFTDHKRPISISEVSDFDEDRTSMKLHWKPQSGSPFDKSPHKYRIETWEPIRRSWEPMALNIPDTSYTVRGLPRTPDHLYRVRMETEQAALSEPSLPVSILGHYNYPRIPVYRPQLHEVDRDTVKLSWQPAIIPDVSMSRRPIGYTIEQREIPDTHWHNVVSDVTDTTYWVRNLRPKSDYEFRVRTIIDGTTSEPSFPVALYRRPVIPRVRFDVPEVEDMDETSLSLRWNKVDVPSFSPHYEPLSFMIERQLLPHYEWEPVATNITDSRYTVRDLEPYQDYNFRVRGVYPSGYTEPSPYVPVYRRPIRHSVPIARTEVWEEAPYSARLRWHRAYLPPYNTTQRHRYRVEMQEAGGVETDWRPAVTSAIEATEVTVNEISPRKDYKFRVRAEMENGDLSDPTPEIQYFRSQMPMTKEPFSLAEYKPVEYEMTFANHPYIDHLCKYVPPRMPIDKPDMVLINSETAELSWRPAREPDAIRGHSNLTYTIEVRTPPSFEWREFVPKLKVLNNTVKNLHPEVDYIFRVRAWNEYGCSEPSLPVSLYRPIRYQNDEDDEAWERDWELRFGHQEGENGAIEEVPPKLSIDTPRIVTQTSDSIWFSWLPARIPVYATQTPITYVIEVKEPPSNAWRRDVTGLIDCQYVREGLNPKQDYQIRVHAETEFGPSEPTLPIVIKRSTGSRPGSRRSSVDRDEMGVTVDTTYLDTITAGVPPRMMSTRPLCTNSTSDRLTLSWSACRVPSYVKNSNVSYVIEKRELPGHVWSVLAKDVTTTRYDITGLNADLDYMFRVRARNDFGMSEPTLPLSIYRERDDYVPQKIRSRSGSRDSIAAYGSWRARRSSSIDYGSNNGNGFVMPEDDSEVESCLRNKIPTQPEYITTTYDMQYGVEGRKGKITLQVKGFPLPKVHWYKGEEKLAYGDKYDTFISSSGSITLEIKNIGMSDVGEYKCYAENESGAAVKVVTLELAEPPTVLQPLCDQVELEYKNLTLSCRVDAFPNATVKWMKDWRPLSDSERVKLTHTAPDMYSLEIVDSIVGDAGIYACTVETVAGKVTSTGRLTVEEMPSICDITMKSTPITDHYHVLEEIGRGKHGVVRRVVEMSTGKSFAANSILMRNRAQKNFFMSEFEVLRSLAQVDGVLKLHDAFETERSLIFVTEIITEQELLEKIVTEDNWTEARVSRVVKNVLTTLKEMESLNILHMDIKPGNIRMCNADSDAVKLINFGFSQTLNPDEDVMHNYGSVGYASPEQIVNDVLSETTDTWSVGVLAYVLLSGVAPFKGSTDTEILNKTLEGQWSFGEKDFEKFSKEGQEFIKQLLVKDPSERLTIEECLQHPWMSTESEAKINTQQLKHFAAAEKLKKKTSSVYTTAELQSLRKILHGTTAMYQPAIDTDTGEIIFPDTDAYGDYLDEDAWYEWQLQYLDDPDSQEFPIQKKEFTVRESRHTAAGADGKTSRDAEEKGDIESDVSIMFRNKIQTQTFLVGEDVMFQCTVVSPQEVPVVTWYRDEQLLSDAYRADVTFNEEKGLAKLKIVNTKDYDAAIYKCVARNKDGRISCQARLLMGDKPGKPSRPLVTQTSGTEAFMTWMGPIADGNSYILGYRIDYKNTDDKKWTIGPYVTEEFALIAGLVPESSYTFRVSCHNKYGTSPFSWASIEAKTQATDCPPINMSSFLQPLVQFTSFSKQQLILPAASRRASLTVRDDATLQETDPTGSYTVGDSIAKGSYGEYRSCVNKTTNQQAVAKIVAYSKDNHAVLTNEFEILRNLRQNNIITVLDGFVTEDLLYVMFEQLSGINIVQYLCLHKSYKEETVAQMIRQVLDALQYLQHFGIAHLNLQPSSIVMATRRRAHVKLRDFTLARKIGTGKEESAPLKGFPDFIAPEVIKKDPVGFSADMWTLGALTFTLLSGISAFSGQDLNETLSNILFDRYNNSDLYDNVSKESVKFINKLLCRLPGNRPDVTKCLNSRWLQLTDSMLKSRTSRVFRSEKLLQFCIQYSERRADITYMDIEAVSVKDLPKPTPGPVVQPILQDKITNRHVVSVKSKSKTKPLVKPVHFDPEVSPEITLLDKVVKKVEKELDSEKITQIVDKELKTKDNTEKSKKDKDNTVTKTEEEMSKLMSATKDNSTKHVEETLATKVEQSTDTKETSSKKVDETKTEQTQLKDTSSKMEITEETDGSNVSSEVDVEKTEVGNSKDTSGKSTDDIAQTTQSKQALTNSKITEKPNLKTEDINLKTEDKTTLSDNLRQEDSSNTTVSPSKTTESKQEENIEKAETETNKRIESKTTNTDNDIEKPETKQNEELDKEKDSMKPETKLASSENTDKSIPSKNQIPVMAEQYVTGESVQKEKVEKSTISEADLEIKNNAKNILENNEKLNLESSKDLKMTESSEEVVTPRSSEESQQLSQGDKASTSTSKQESADGAKMTPATETASNSDKEQTIPDTTSSNTTANLQQTDASIENENNRNTEIDTQSSPNPKTKVSADDVTDSKIESSSDESKNNESANEMMTASANKDKISAETSEQERASVEAPNKDSSSTENVLEESTSSSTESTAEDKNSTEKSESSKIKVEEVSKVVSSSTLSTLPEEKSEQSISTQSLNTDGVTEEIIKATAKQSTELKQSSDCTNIDDAKSVNITSEALQEIGSVLLDMEKQESAKISETAESQEIPSVVEEEIVKIAKSKEAETSIETVTEKQEQVTEKLNSTVENSKENSVQQSSSQEQIKEEESATEAKEMSKEAVKSEKESTIISNESTTKSSSANLKSVEQLDSEIANKRNISATNESVAITSEQDIVDGNIVSQIKTVDDQIGTKVTDVDESKTFSSDKTKQVTISTSETESAASNISEQVVSKSDSGTSAESNEMESQNVTSEETCSKSNTEVEATDIAEVQSESIESLSETVQSSAIETINTDIKQSLESKQIQSSENQIVEAKSESIQSISETVQSSAIETINTDIKQSETVESNVESKQIQSSENQIVEAKSESIQSISETVQSSAIETINTDIKQSETVESNVESKQIQSSENQIVEAKSESIQSISETEQSSATETTNTDIKRSETIESSVEIKQIQKSDNDIVEVKTESIQSISETVQNSATETINANITQSATAESCVERKDIAETKTESIQYISETVQNSATATINADKKQTTTAESCIESKDIAGTKTESIQSISETVQNSATENSNTDIKQSETVESSIESKQIQSSENDIVEVKTESIQSISEKVENSATETVNADIKQTATVENKETVIASESVVRDGEENATMAEISTVNSLTLSESDVKQQSEVATASANIKSEVAGTTESSVDVVDANLKTIEASQLENVSIKTTENTLENVSDNKTKIETVLTTVSEDAIKSSAEENLNQIVETVSEKSEVTQQLSITQSKVEKSFETCLTNTSSSGLTSMEITTEMIGGLELTSEQIDAIINEKMEHLIDASQVTKGAYDKIIETRLIIKERDLKLTKDIPGSSAICGKFLTGHDVHIDSKAEKTDKEKEVAKEEPDEEEIASQLENRPVMDDALMFC